MVSVEPLSWSSSLTTRKSSKSSTLQQLYSNLVFCVDPCSKSSIIAFNKSLGLSICAQITDEMVELRTIFGQNLFVDGMDILEALDKDRLRMCEGFMEDEMVDVRLVYVEPADELRARCRSRNCSYVMSKDDKELVCRQCRLLLGLEGYDDHDVDNGVKKEYGVEDRFTHFLDEAQNDDDALQTNQNEEEVNQLGYVVNECSYEESDEEKPIVRKRGRKKIKYNEDNEDYQDSDEEEKPITVKGGSEIIGYDDDKEDNANGEEKSSMAKKGSRMIDYNEDSNDQEIDEKPILDEESNNINDDFEPDEEYANSDNSDNSDMEEDVNSEPNLMPGTKEKDGIMSVKDKKALGPKETTKSLTQCPKCLNSYRRISTVEKHVREGCPVNRNVSYQDTILNKRKAADELSGAFKCNLCLRNFHSRKSLAVHLVNHRRKLGNLSAPVKCPICSEWVKSKSKLNKHIHEQHDPNQGCCIQCRSVMPNEDLGEHMSTAHIERPHLCSICGTSFVNKSLLALHISTKHDSSKTRVMCDICGKVFAHRVRLQQHFRFFHSMEKNECKFCGKTFPSRHAMYKHKKMHSKNKPFHCSLCDYSSVVRANVTAHVRKVHKVEVVEDQHVVKIGRFEFDE